MNANVTIANKEQFREFIMDYIPLSEKKQKVIFLEKYFENFDPDVSGDCPKKAFKDSLRARILATICSK